MKKVSIFFWAGGPKNSYIDIWQILFWVNNMPTKNKVLIIPFLSYSFLEKEKTDQELIY